MTATWVYYDVFPRNKIVCWSTELFKGHIDQLRKLKATRKIQISIYIIIYELRNFLLKLLVQLVGKLFK